MMCVDVYGCTNNDVVWSSGAAAIRQVSMPLVARLDPTESDNILDRLSAVYDDTVSTWCP